MPREIPPQDSGTIIRFGGGLNSRVAADQIEPTEAAAGFNFSLDVDNGSLKPREAFKLVGTTPNLGEIRGFAQLENIDGSHATLIQSGDKVYDWDGTPTGFIEKGTVAPTARLRGQRWHNWDLGDTVHLDPYVIITDLSKTQPVSRYDGDVFENLPTDFLTPGVPTDEGVFFAKYCFVDDERVYFGNVRETVDTPWVVNFTEVNDPRIMSPPTTPTETSPSFIVAPDSKPVNGVVSAFERKVISTAEGRLHQLTGTRASDYAISTLYPDSGADGDESLAYIGNDIAYGKSGRLETAFATIQLGDVETDDLSRKIAPDVRDLTDWTVAYSSRFQKVYFFSVNVPQVFVMHKGFIDERLRKVAQRVDVPNISPWSVYTTNHPMAFQPSTVMTMHDPLTNLENVYMGDQDGNFYVIEGGTGKDGGTDPVVVTRQSGVVQAELRQDIYDITGWVKYKKEFFGKADIVIQWGGRQFRDVRIPLTFEDASTAAYYSGIGIDAAYYNDDAYYASQFSGRLARQNFEAVGRSDQFQVSIEAESDFDFEIAEIGVRFTASE